MEEIIKQYLDSDVKLIEKYKKAEERYYKKLGENYDTVQIDLGVFEAEEIKKLFRALANSEICLDDYLICILKQYIVENEMEKIWENSLVYKEYGI